MGITEGIIQPFLNASYKEAQVVYDVVSSEVMDKDPPTVNEKVGELNK